MQSLFHVDRWLGAVLSPDGLIIALSGNAEECTGYPIRELRGRSITSLLSPSSALEMECLLGSPQGCGAWEGTIEHSGRNGALLEVKACLIPLEFLRETGAAFLLVLAFEAEQETGERAVSLPEVASHLRRTVHDLNSPLAVMMGLTQLILLDSRCGERFRGDIERLLAAMMRVAEITEQLHAYAFTLQGEAARSDPQERAPGSLSNGHVQPGAMDQSR